MATRPQDCWSITPDIAQSRPTCRDARSRTCASVIKGRPCVPREARYIWTGLLQPSRRRPCSVRATFLAVNMPHTYQAKADAGKYKMRTSSWCRPPRRSWRTDGGYKRHTEIIRSGGSLGDRSQSAASQGESASSTRPTKLIGMVEKQASTLDRLWTHRERALIYGMGTEYVHGLPRVSAVPMQASSSSYTAPSGGIRTRAK